MKFKLLSFSLLFIYSAQIIATEGHVGFDISLQPDSKIYSPGVVYDQTLADNLVFQAKVGITTDSTMNSSNNVLVRSTLFYSHSLHEDGDLLIGPLLQYTDNSNPVHYGATALYRKYLEDFSVHAGFSVISNSDLFAAADHELLLGISWPLGKPMETYEAKSVVETAEAKSVVETPPAIIEPKEEAVDHVVKDHQTVILAQEPSFAVTDLFKINSSYIQNYADLDKTVAKMTVDDTQKVNILNRHSRGGTVEYNQWLADRRERSIRHYLESKGIRGDRIEIMSSLIEKEPVKKPVVEIRLY